VAVLAHTVADAAAGTVADGITAGVVDVVASTKRQPANRREPGGSRTISPAWSAIFDSYASHDPRLRQIADRAVPVEPGRLDPRRLMMTLDGALPDDAVVVVGGGHCMAFAAQFLHNRSGRRSFHMVFDFMTTGQAVPAAIGAAVACPGRMVVAVEGDASVLMHVQELETAARSGIALLVVVVNDGALGAEYHKLAALGVDPSEALAPTPDLGEVARPLGGRGRQVSDLAGVADLPTSFEPDQGPYMADCAVSLAVVGPL
jgi:thiamine pyrophosphate-dependent acetolactate synthase large subunit-like protein